MKKEIYFCIVMLLCCIISGCARAQSNYLETTDSVGVAATQDIAETTAAVTIAFLPETTAAVTIAFLPETTAAVTETNAAETTTMDTVESVATIETTIPETTAAQPKASAKSEFMPTTIAGNYTYNDGSAPVIEVVDGFTYVNGILIVNKTYDLPEDFNPGGLHPDAQAAFDRMQAAAAAEGVALKIISGFRSYSKQYSTYNNYSARDGKELADRYSARPGHSEHQTGLAMDINSLQQSFADTAAGKWLAEHCAEYGFIIRYGADTEEKTGFMYEPWHIRYLGAELAKAVTESGLCLEEYLGITSVYAE